MSRSVKLVDGRVTFEFGRYRAQRKEDGIWYYGASSEPMPPVVPAQGAMCAAIQEMLLLRAAHASLVVENAKAWAHIHDLNQAAIEHDVLRRHEG